MQFLTVESSEIIRNYGLVAAALIGFPLAIWRSYIAHKQTESIRKQAGISADNHLAETYTKAIDQIGDDNDAIKLGGLYALEKIALSNQEYHGQIMEVLSAFVRLHAPLEVPLPIDESKTSDENQEARPLPTSIIVQAALTIIGRRAVGFDVEGVPINLSLTHLQKADLQKADLQKADLRRTSLLEADLREVKLQKADLRWADLRAADLRAADLQKVDFIWADLREADLRKADLRGAYLIEADLQNAGLREADLREAYLIEADLRKADLRKADLRAADLMEANLTGADLREADLREADLTGADLREADLTRAILTVEQIKSATIDKDTVIPESIDPTALPPHSGHKG
jgi:uncharacterized protein YjbI with pentapeptide repeats